MRPLRIEIQGFTAFRERQVVSLEDLDLFVITGPTGAGKSSLLDAMIFALFGKVPRMGGHGLSDLVSQGLAEARIQLDFSVDEERYRIARRLRRKGANSATLERAEGDGWNTEVAGGGVRAVDKRVVELVKLSFDAFTRAVVLPQGEFQRFLRGDRDQRRDVLTDLLGLRHYETMGARARARIRVLDASLEATQKILDDQFADATSERLAEVKAACKAATAAAQALATAAATANELDDRATTMREGLVLLEARQAEIGEIRVGLAETLTSSVKAREHDGVLNKAITKAEKRIVAAETKVSDAKAGLAQLIKQYGSIEDLVRADEALKTHHQCQNDLNARDKQLDVVTSDLATLKTSVKAAEGDLKALTKALDAARTETERAEQVAHESSDAAREIANRLERAERTADELSEAKEHASACAERLKEANDASARAQHGAQVAETEAATLTIEHAAAALAEHLRAGDPCPVCHRALDADPDFDEHVAESFASAEARRTQARDLEAKAARALAVAEAAHGTAADRADQAQAALDQVLQGFDTIKVLREQAKAAKQSSGKQLGLQAAARKQAEQASQAESDARVALANLTTTLTSKDSTVKSLKADCDELRRRSATAARTLETQFEGGIPSDAASQLERRQKAVSAASETLESAQRNANDAHMELKTATAAQVDLREELAQLDMEVAGSRVRCETVYRQLGEAIVVVEQDGLLAPLPTVAAAREARIGDLASWCDATKNASVVAGRAAEKALEDLDRQLVRLIKDHAIEVHDGLSPAGAMKAAEQSARDAKVRSEEAVQQAEQRLAQRAQLSESIEDKQSEVVLLRSLAAELRADRFVQFIVQQTLDLLAIRASEQLLKISAGRYSLTSHDGEFSVIDHANADEERSVKTLSGGETFLASLSLALALSQHVGELATEGLGAKLEAVFIDEGFGALDAETLEDVIDALERLRESNLMVGVITHVSALADRIRVGIRIEKRQNKSTIVDAAAA